MKLFLSEFVSSEVLNTEKFLKLVLFLFMYCDKMRLIIITLV